MAVLGYWMPLCGSSYVAQMAFDMVLRRARYGFYENIKVLVDRWNAQRKCEIDLLSVTR